MRIQKILPPNNNLKSLYFKELDSLMREKETISITDTAFAKSTGSAGRNTIIFPLSLKKGEIISFETYMNSLVIDKWVTLTKASNIALKLRTNGKVIVRLYNSVGVYDWDDSRRAAGRKEVEVPIDETQNKGIYEYSISLSQVNCNGVVYPIIEAVEDCDFLGGEYVCDDVKSLTPIKPCYVINYNRDARTTRSNIDALTGKKGYSGELIIVCDMTGGLGDNVFIDNSRSGGNIVQISTSKERGQCFNQAMDYIRNEAEEYTHIVMIDCDVIVDENALARLFTFVSLLDDIRDQVIIQGDILRDGRVLDSSGHVVIDDEPHVRFRNFDISKADDFVAAVSYEELDFFRFGLLCIPTGVDIYLDPNIREYVEFEYYLNCERLDVASINGFMGHSLVTVGEGIIWSLYYNTRDYLIAIINSGYEMGKQDFINFIDKEVKKQYKKGGLELAVAIIEAANDFLNGPEGLTDTDCEEELRDRLIELSGQFNDNLTSRKNKVKDRLELQKYYNKLSLKIDHDYDMIMDKWTQSKRKVDHEREQ